MLGVVLTGHAGRDVAVLLLLVVVNKKKVPLSYGIPSSHCSDCVLRDAGGLLLPDNNLERAQRGDPKKIDPDGIPRAMSPKVFGESMKKS